MPETENKIFDLLIVGGGINGVGIARDAAGRGLKVALCEQADLGSATSSASSKLIHGGLRYLEHYEFSLVRESLAEREVLLRIAPHLVWPMRFVLPHAPQLRPAWMIRIGLFLYDHLTRRVSLPGSHGVDLRNNKLGTGLKPEFRKGFVYSDCATDDARLVIANARGAADAGAKIMVRTACTGAEVTGDTWRVALEDRVTGEHHHAHARVLINAAGPWVTGVRQSTQGLPPGQAIRLVKGSHIVVPRLHDEAHAYILQNDDRRQVFVIPYERELSLIGTTEAAVVGDPGQKVDISDNEITYLCRATARYLKNAAKPEDVVWSYAGLRPLVDDRSADPSAITRDYTLDLDLVGTRVPVLTIYGGKITTYRHLAEDVLAKLRPFLPHMGAAWTDAAALPGGDVPNGDINTLVDELRHTYPKLPASLLNDLAHRYGTLSRELLGDTREVEVLGKYFGAGLYAREIDYLIEQEWAQTADDILWRRTKTGLHMTNDQRTQVQAYMASQHTVARSNRN
ncbi:MAG: glycerol-3-phosphate dehydrogenase [Acidiferrobacterales bacterium]